MQTQVGALSAMQFALLSPAQLAALNPSSLGGVTAAQLAKLEPEQLAALTPKQFVAMFGGDGPPASWMPRVDVLKQLPRALLAAATGAQLRTLTDEQMQYLTNGAAADADQAMNLFEVRQSGKTVVHPPPCVVFKGVRELGRVRARLALAGDVRTRVLVPGEAVRSEGETCLSVCGWAVARCWEMGDALVTLSRACCIHS